MIKSYSYKRALRLQFSVILVALLLIIIIGWKLYPVNTLDKTISFCIYVLLIGGMTIFGVRKAGYKVLCGSCKLDIFSFIDLGNVSGKKVNFCPLCGEIIDDTED